jgi:CDP-diacylglycerol--glycerol-3-phosphate 3-phosphatidyltransferase
MEHIDSSRTEGTDGARVGAAPALTTGMERLRDFVREHLEAVLTPVAALLLRLGVKANQVSVAGVLLTVVAAALIVAGNLWLAGLVYLVAGMLDMLDGILARLAKSDSRFGAFLDSTLDRISEGVVFAALAYYLAQGGNAVDAGLVVLALLGSLLVSYTRARAEGLGIECKVGIVTRAERVVLIAFALLSGWLTGFIYLLLVLTGITVAQRVHRVHQQAATKR